jgi:hypothetical protein
VHTTWNLWCTTRIGGLLVLYVRLLFSPTSIEINHRPIHWAYDARIMATIIKRPYGFQLRVSHKLLPKDLWATFDTREAAEQYGRQLEGLLAQRIVPAALLERDQPRNEIWTVGLLPIPQTPS